MPSREWPLDARGEAIMTAKARQMGINVSPRKINLVTKLIRFLPVPEAHRQLAGCTKKTAPLISSVLVAAVRNARAYGLREDRLIVNEAFVGKGRYLARIRPWHGKGRFGVEHKKYAHLTIIVRELDDELWEFKAMPHYLHFRRTDRIQQDDAAHSVHKSETVSWVSDLDKCLANTNKNIESLQISLDQEQLLQEEASEQQQSPSIASNDENDKPLSSN